MKNVRIFDLRNTPAADTYNGCGRAILVVQSGIHVHLTYLLDNDPEYVNINFSDGGEKISEVWRGMASCMEFVGEELAYSPEQFSNGGVKN